jgi:hypothetical protein
MPRWPWYPMLPLLGALTHLHLGPARTAGPFSYFGREGACFLGGVILQMYNEFHHTVTERPVAL